ncbi:MAG: Eco57I restriction-modification methylase domain-containing protein [Promethearchaeota archaeon]
MEFLNSLESLGENLWKYHTLCFMYNPKMVSFNLFTERNGLPILKVIKNTLQLKNISWICLIQQETILIFSLSSNGFLLWSPILKGIAPYLIASILSDKSILDSINDLWRWDFLEMEKSQLLNFVNKLFKNSLQNEKDKKNFVSQFFSLIDYVLKIKEDLIQQINDEFLSLVLYNTDRIRQVHQFLNLQDRMANIILESLGTSRTKEKLSHNPLKDYYWLVDVSPLLFLEIIPQIKNLSGNENLGVFFTPIALAETIITRTFNVFIDQGLARTISDLKVFDPAMGTGILLVFAIEWLVNQLILDSSNNNSFIELRRKIAYSNIKGVDIDEDSILICKNFLKTFYLQEMNSRKKFDLEAIDFFQLFVQSSELDQLPPKFDVILSNPPYLAFHSRFTKKFPLNVELRTLRKLIPVFSGKRDNTYLLFLGICLQQFLAPKGVVGFVIDHSFLDLPSYKKIRRHLLSKYHVSYILATYNYRKTAVVDLSLIVIRNSQDSQTTLWQESLDELTRKLTKEHFIAQSNYSFLYQERISLLSHLNVITIPLGDIASLSCGLEYGALLKTNFLSSKASKGFYKCIDGSNGLSYPYLLFWISKQPNSYVRFDKEYEKQIQDANQNISSTNKKVILISGDLHRFLTEKIILRQTATKFIATLDKQKYLTLRNTHLIYDPKPPYSLYLILGILCSSLGNYLGEQFNIIRKSRKEFSRYPQIRLNDLKEFPIINIKKKTGVLSTDQLTVVFRS